MLAYEQESYRLVDSLDVLKRMCAAYLSRKTPVYLDTETTGLNPRHNKLVMVQVMQEGHAPVIIDWRRFLDNGQEEAAASLLSPVFQACECVGHNIAFDGQFLSTRGMPLNKVWDTQIAEQVIYSARPKGVTLQAVVKKYCDVWLDKAERKWFYTPAPLDERPDEWNAPFPTEELEYGAKDVLYLPEIVRQQKALLKERGLTRVVNLELRALPAIAAMSMNGIRVDTESWQAAIDEQVVEAEALNNEVVDEFGEAIIQAKQQLYEKKLDQYNAWREARDYFLGDLRYWYETNGSDRYPVREGEKWGAYKVRVMQAWRAEHPNPGQPKPDNEFNLGSAQQLLMGFKVMGIPAEKTDKDTLGKLADEFPSVRKLVMLNGLNHIISTYGSSLLARVESDGRMHPGFHSIGAETGRMSSHSPNWQNIPARTELGKRLRQCVVASPGHKLLVADYSIIELRILAEMSQDKNMISMFGSGMDLHTYTARLMFMLPESMTDDEVKAYKLPNGLKARDVAKTINYGVAYGQSAFGFARKFDVDVDTAQGFIDAWYDAYGGARRFLDERAEAAVSLGYSKTILGRKRFFDVPEHPGRGASRDALKEYKQKIGSIRRAGMNASIQGTSADMTKLAIALFWEQSDHDTQRLVCVVHDELVVECPDDIAEETKALLSRCMLKAAKTLLRTVAVPDPDVHVGEKWEH